MSYAEIVLRTAAVIVLVALAGLMTVSRRRDHTPRLGALFALAVAAFVLTSGDDAAAWLGPWFYPLTAICVAKSAFFWLFARGLFSDRFRVRPMDVVAIGLIASYGLWQQLIFDPRWQMGLATAWERLAAAGFELAVLVLVLLALAEAHRGLTTDLVERRRRLRIVFVAGVSGYLAAAAIVQGYNLALGAQTPPLLVVTNLVLIMTGALAAIWNLVQMRTASWLDPDPADVAPESLSPLERQILDSLKEQLDGNRIYRQEGLTIAALAARLRTREHILRRVINQGLGYRNFNDFLHAYRIREACERLRHPEDVRLPVLSIALGVGYGSIGPFNRAFKARMGMTPTLYRQGARKT